MEGKVFDGVISSQMRFKKTFSRQTFGEEKKIMVEKFSLQKLRSNSGDEKMKS